MKREKNEEYRDSQIMTINIFSFKEQKHWKMKREKNEEYRDSQLMTINIFSFTFDIIIIFFSKTWFWKKVVYTITFYLQFLCVAGYLKRSSHTPKVNIHKYANYNIIEIYKNRLNTATQIFIAIDYLILMSRKHVAWKLFPTTKK